VSQKNNTLASGFVHHVGRCPRCGKRRYTSKRDAKAVIRQLRDRMNAYRCGEYWHVGHLPKPVIAGDAGRDDIFPVTPRQNGDTQR
jgi:hypothetical protein